MNAFNLSFKLSIDESSIVMTKSDSFFSFWIIGGGEGGGCPNNETQNLNDFFNSMCSGEGTVSENSYFSNTSGKSRRENRIRIKYRQIPMMKEIFEKSLRCMTFCINSKNSSNELNANKYSK